MVVRQRARHAQDKQERYNAILDAAQRLLLRSPEREANVAEVAEEAGLAKGTVYLYFPSKEELLLALHERNVDVFFRELCQLLEGSHSVDIDDVLALTREHMIDPPLFLPLAARCLGNISLSVPAESRLAFGQRLGDWLARAGVGLVRHFDGLPPAGGIALLRYSYSLILGLWQLSGAEARAIPALLREHAPYNLSYADNIDRALRSLWQGAVGPRDSNAGGTA